MPNFELDDIDRCIIAELQADARLFRAVIDRYRTGIPWCDQPERY